MAIFPNTVPAHWNKGGELCAKKLLGLGIILYGFRITLERIATLICPEFFTALIIICCVAN